MHLLDPRNGPGHDLSPAPHRRTLVVASSPRTGSTLLCRALWETGQLGAPKEYLNPMQLRDWSARSGSRAHTLLRGPLVPLAGRRPWSDQRLRTRLDLLRRHRTGHNGWFSLKIHHHHYRRFFEAAERDPSAFLGPLTWVHIQRQDRVAQAVSWVRAKQTGRWIAEQRGFGRAHYSHRAISRALHAIDAQEQAWARILEPYSPLHLCYEDVADDLLSAVNAVLAHCEQPPVEAVSIPLRRQADPESEAWARRFRGGR